MHHLGTVIMSPPRKNTLDSISHSLSSATTTAASSSTPYVTEFDHNLGMSTDVINWILNPNPTPPSDAPAQDECNGTKHALVATLVPEKTRFKHRHLDKSRSQ